MKRLAVILFFLLLGQFAQAASDREYVIISGGPSLIEWEKYKQAPHDIWWGNFIRGARVRIDQLRQEFGPDAKITWLVYRPGYVRRSQRQDKTDRLADIKSVKDKYGINLVWFDNADQLINYINAGQPRSTVKIADLEYFGHSNRACFMFDYSNEIDSASKVYLHETDLAKIHRGIFTRDAFVKSWGCYTGESMSKTFKQATGKKMIGAIGKTDYSGSHEPGWMPHLSPGGRWGG